MKLFAWFTKRSLKVKIGLIIVFISIGVVVWRTFAGGNKQTYNTEPVTKADITEMVDESGVVHIAGQTHIYSPTTGIIEEVYVANGKVVKTGQDLFKVKSTATQMEQQAALADYLAAKAAVEQAEANLPALQADMFAKWDSFKELAESDDYEDSDGNPKHANRALPEFHIPEKQWLASEKAYTSQQQVISQAKVRASAAWLAYQTTQTATVKATADGEVANLSVTAMDNVFAPSASAQGKPVLTIADFSSAGVLVSLNENDINKVSVGNIATVKVDAIKNHEYNGIVQRVDAIGHDNGAIVRYDIYVLITDMDERLKSGMSADVEITTAVLSDVLSVPNNAIKPYKGGRAVQIVNDKNELEFVPVIIGTRGTERTQIIEGVKEGQPIVTALTNEQAQRSGVFGL